MCDTFEAIIVLFGVRGENWELLEVLHQLLAIEPYYSTN